jgi:hypothetical protein
VPHSSSSTTCTHTRTVSRAGVSAEPAAILRFAHACPANTDLSVTAKIRQDPKKNFSLFRLNKCFQSHEAPQPQPIPEFSKISSIAILIFGVRHCNGHPAVVERLIQEKADINAHPCGYCGRTALQAAAEGGHLAVVERLIQEKADINAAPSFNSGRTALQAAAQGGHLAVVERLIQERPMSMLAHAIILEGLPCRLRLKEAIWPLSND